MEEEEDQRAKDCKVVLLGESGVGKTSIISRFIHDIFNKEVLTSTSSSFVSKEIVFKEYQNQAINFVIWDTAGQEKYRSLTKLFYKDSSIIILVYDITNEASFNEIKNYWYEQLKENSPTDISKFLSLSLFYYIYKYSNWFGSK